MQWSRIRRVIFRVISLLRISKFWKTVGSRRSRAFRSQVRVSRGEGPSALWRLYSTTIYRGSGKQRDGSWRKMPGPDLYIAVYARTEKKVHAVLPFTSNAARIQAALNTMQIGPLRAGAYVERNLQGSPLMERVDQVAAEMAPIRGGKAMALFSGPLAAIGGTITRPNGTTATA